MGDKTAGLFDGFEGYRSATHNDLVEAVTQWLVVLDTNVLLSLYQFQGRTLSDLVDVLDAVGDRLFVPHQVADEFWRNRRTVLKENEGRHREPAKIHEDFESIRKSFSKWYSRVVDRGGTPPSEVLRELEEAADAMADFIRRETQKAAPIAPDTPTYDDRVLALIEPLLEGKVGRAPDEDELKGLRAEGLRRIGEKVPPGYQDAGKSNDRSVGDFLVWHQTMQESKRRGLPVLFVTLDQKEDWWADPGTRSMRARPELVRELLAVSGHRLLMVRSHDLLGYGEHLGVEVSAATVQEAEAVVDESTTGWSAELVDAYAEILAHGWPNHFRMLLLAMDDEEFSISREAMATTLDRHVDAPMTGITRPYFTAIKVLRDQGYIASEDELTVPLFAWYDDDKWMSHLVMEEDVQPAFAARRSVLNSVAADLTM